MKLGVRARGAKKGAGVLNNNNRMVARINNPGALERGLELLASEDIMKRGGEEHNGGEHSPLTNKILRKDLIIYCEATKKLNNISPELGNKGDQGRGKKEM